MFYQLRWSVLYQLRWSIYQAYGLFWLSPLGGHVGILCLDVIFVSTLKCLQPGIYGPPPFPKTDARPLNMDSAGGTFLIAPVGGMVT